MLCIFSKEMHQMHLLPFDVGSRVVTPRQSLWSQGVLHSALRSDARPTVVQDEDIILVPAVVRTHPDDLDGPFVEVAQEQLRKVVVVSVRPSPGGGPCDVHADARGRGEEIPEAE